MQSLGANDLLDLRCSVLNLRFLRRLQQAMAVPNSAQLTSDVVEATDSQNQDPAIAAHLLRPRLNISKLNLDLQAANFAKQNGVYSAQPAATATDWNGELYALGAFAGLLLLAVLL